MLTTVFFVSASRGLVSIPTSYTRFVVNEGKELGWPFRVCNGPARYRISLVAPLTRSSALLDVFLSFTFYVILSQHFSPRLLLHRRTVSFCVRRILNFAFFSRRFSLAFSVHLAIKMLLKARQTSFHCFKIKMFTVYMLIGSTASEFKAWRLSGVGKYRLKQHLNVANENRLRRRTIGHHCHKQQLQLFSLSLLLIVAHATHQLDHFQFSSRS